MKVALGEAGEVGEIDCAVGDDLSLKARTRCGEPAYVSLAWLLLFLLSVLDATDGSSLLPTFVGVRLVGLHTRPFFLTTCLVSKGFRGPPSYLSLPSTLEDRD